MQGHRFLTRILLSLFITILLAFPRQALEGAQAGLMLWFRIILPTLLPFLIASRLCISFRLANTISRLSYPILKRIPKLSLDGCYPFILGQISGFPVGAVATAQLCEEGKLNTSEGTRLLPLCNNLSPAFLLSYVSMQTLNLGNSRFIFWSIILISSFLGAWLGNTFWGKMRKSIDSSSYTTKSNSLPSPIQLSPHRHPFQIIDEAIAAGFETITKIGGYIILFSLLSYILGSLSLIPMRFRIIMILLLEITTGMNTLAEASLFSASHKIILAAACCAFGGLSSMAQTQSVIASSGLSIRYYIQCRLLSAFFAAIMTMVLLLIQLL